MRMSWWETFSGRPRCCRWSHRSAAHCGPASAVPLIPGTMPASMRRLSIMTQQWSWVNTSTAASPNAMTDLAGRQPDITEVAVDYRQRLHEAALAALQRAAGRGELAAAYAAVITAATLGVLAVARASPDPPKRST